VARIPAASRPETDGHVTITQVPQAHGDHFHLGDATVASSDATGLENQAVWNALSRKGMIRAEWPHNIALTPQGVSYDTGLADQILRRGGQH
jgi:ribosomal protein S19E (S16A)